MTRLKVRLPLSDKWHFIDTEEKADLASLVLSEVFDKNLSIHDLPRVTETIDEWNERKECAHREKVEAQRKKAAPELVPIPTNQKKSRVRLNSAPVVPFRSS